jgi:transketolase
MKTLVLNQNQKLLRRRIIEISFKNNLSHIGSCLNVIDLVDGVYSHKKKDDLFVLSAGHSAVSWYAVLEKFNPGVKFDNIICIHPDKLSNDLISVSTGSLGQGLPIAVGMALADKDIEVYCLISDGECAEGSIWESLRVISENSITNLTVIVSSNGYGAYDLIKTPALKKRLKGFGLEMIVIDGNNPLEIKQALEIKARNVPRLIFANTSSEQLSFLQGLGAHYYVLGQDYLEAANKFK